jgi:CRISPR/Cas system CSM-associated protein Csm3 (group 7 of RAMP superfamily)
MIGSHQFETQQIPLGGGRSRGLGVVELDIKKMLWVDVEGHPEFLLDYLRKIVNEDETAYEDAEDYKDDWVQSLIKHIRDKMAELTPSSPTS